MTLGVVDEASQRLFCFLKHRFNAFGSKLLFMIQDKASNDIPAFSVSKYFTKDFKSHQKLENVTEGGGLKCVKYY